MRNTIPLIGAAVMLGLTTVAPAHATVMLGPLPYTSTDSSPFKGMIGTSEFFLEDMEDGLFNTPGVLVDHGHLRGPGSQTDSVDADDGQIDGLGNDGWSWTFDRSDRGLTFVFDDDTLGTLPTHVGLVWTDGDPLASIVFEAFDGAGELIGSIISAPIGDASTRGTTADDHFFGVIDERGVAAIRITGSRGFMEIDHLQFGTGALNVPEPGSLLALLSAGVLLLRRRRHNTRRAAIAWNLPRTSPRS